MDKAKLTLKGARVIAGLTQEQMASKLGVHPQTIADWEKRPTKVSMSKAKEIVELLKVDYDIFFAN